MILNREQFDAFSMEIATFGNIPNSVLNVLQGKEKRVGL